MPQHPALRVLSFRNYRLLFTGQAISLTGTWMQQVATSWLLYRLTGSALSLGLVTFIGNVPSLFLNPLGGVLADRVNLRRIIFVTQCLSMLQAFLLWGLSASDQVQVWHLYALNFFLGVVNAFDVPARQSFVVRVIEDRSLLSNAIALNSTLFNTARLVGPAIAGVLIAALGESTCFLVNALSYLGALAALWRMNLDTPPRLVHTTPIWNELQEGFRYVAGHRSLRSILLVMTGVALVGMPYGVLLPVFAREILLGGPKTLGFLTTCTGLGAMAGALFLVRRRGISGLAKFIPLGMAMLGLGLAAFAWSRSLALSAVLLVFASLGNMVGIAACHTILQSVADDDKRGRVLSFFSLTMMGFTPFGGLAFGWLATHIGAPWTVFLGGLATLAAAAMFAMGLQGFRHEIRGIYKAKGIGA